MGGRVSTELHWATAIKIKQASKGHFQRQGVLVRSEMMQ